MPSKSEAQRKFIFSKRNEYKSEEKAPKNWKWVFEKSWETLEESLRVQKTSQDFLIRIQESLYKDFREFLSFNEKSLAEKTWGEVVTSREGQIELLNAAKEGDPTAINYLFLKSSAILGKVFTTTFLGSNPRSIKTRIARGDQNVFVGLVYDILYGASKKDKASPLNTFDPDVFSEDTDLIKKFGYYLMRYVEAEAIRYNKAERKEGITGNISSEEERAIRKSYSLDSEESPDIITGDVENDLAEIKQDFKKFLEDPELNKKIGKFSLKDLFKEVVKNKDFDVSELSSTLELSQTRVTSLLRQLGELFSDYDITSQDLSKLFSKDINFIDELLKN